MKLHSKWLATATLGTVAIGAMLAPTKQANYDYQDATDEGNRVAYDKEGNVYVAATCKTTNDGAEDIVVIKYSPAFVKLWAKEYNGTGSGIDTVTGLVIDQSQNVYVSCTSQGSSTGKDIAVLALDRDGDPKWTGSAFHNGAKRWNSSGSVDDTSTDLAIDNNGNLYVSGYYNEGSATNGVIVGIEPDGDLKTGWPVVYGAANNIERFNAVAVDNSLTILAGGAKAVTNQGLNLLVARYNGSGTLIEDYNANHAGLDDEAFDVCFGTKDRLIAAGTVHATGSNGERLAADCFQADPPGVTWSRVLTQRSEGVAVTKSNHLVSNGFVHVTGHLYDTSTTFRLVATKISESNGQFSTTWPASGGFSDGIRLADSSAAPYDCKGRSIWASGNNVYATGMYFHPATGGDVAAHQKIITSGFSPSGGVLFTELYGSVKNLQGGNAVTVFCAGQPLVTGKAWETSENSVTSYDAKTLMYNAVTTIPVANSNSYTIEAGTGDGSPVTDLDTSDTSQVVITADDHSANPKAAISMESTSIGAASELCFEVETRVSATGVDQLIQFYNFDNSAWVTFDTRHASTTSRTLHQLVISDPDPYISSAGKAKARIRFNDVGVMFGGDWYAYINVARWHYMN